VEPAVTPHHCHLSAADGTRLHVTDYLLPVSKARGSIVLMHGLGEHSGRYRHVAQFLNDWGLSVRAYDHRGHGRSEGKRGDVINGDPILQDAEIVIEDFSSGFAEPPFLLGHSMGGLFAARFALTQLAPLRGLILSSPALAVRLGGAQQMMLKLLYCLAPALTVPNRLPVHLLSHDPAVSSQYKADPLVHSKISARLLTSMLSSIDYCASHANSMKIPTLMLVAGDDHLVDPEGSKRFFARLPSGLGQMHLYPDFYHEVFNEIEAGRPLGDLREWLDRAMV
jgi:alpha-beta hydrolase superfamily lysophospholipase